MERVWNTTLAAADAVLNDEGDRRPPPLRLWARNIRTVRSRTVFEGHLERWLADYWALPVQKALWSTAVSAARALRPEEGESWREKLARISLAFRHASTPRSEHDRALARRRRP